MTIMFWAWNNPYERFLLHEVESMVSYTEHHVKLDIDVLLVSRFDMIISLLTGKWWTSEAYLSD
jgi:hypothetical protein